jgi:peptidase C13-like protein
MKQVVRMALRAVAWRATADVSPVGFGIALVCSAAFFLVGIGLQYLQAGTISAFNPYGLNASIAVISLSMLTVALFVPAGRRTTFVAGMAVLFIVYNVASDAIAPPLLQAMPAPMQAWWTSDIGRNIAFGLVLIWLVGASAAILRSILPATVASGRFVRAAGMWIALVAVVSALPLYPVFKTKDFQLATANFWELARAGFQAPGQRDEPAPRHVDRAQVELAQAELMEAALAGLAPQHPNKVDIYALGIAGWSDQDVFQRELDGGLAAIARTLPIEGRTLRLINHPDRAATAPSASRQNFAAAVRAIGQSMDKDEDILLLFLTSHGSEEGVTLKLTGAFNVDLSPEDMALVLERAGIKNRIVIVSACYSGIFIKPLANDNTIVLTAADEENPSFGCADDREWTYFGEALFDRSLRPGQSLDQAFAEAKDLISAWETRDALRPSNPQAHFGQALLRKLAPFYAGAESTDEATAPPRRKGTGG